MTSGYYILNTDGGMVSSGRRADDDPPGEAAIAVLLKKTKKGRKTEAVVESFRRHIGPRMNDEAEYEALLEGLRTAIKHEATHVRAFMDSEFIVEQINNGVTPKEKDLVPLYREARKLIKKFAPDMGFRLSWIPRQRNAEAACHVCGSLDVIGHGRNERRVRDRSCGYPTVLEPKKRCGCSAATAGPVETAPPWPPAGIRNDRDVS
jgi:ribonuclease HI